MPKWKIQKCDILSNFQTLWRRMRGDLITWDFTFEDPRVTSYKKSWWYCAVLPDKEECCQCNKMQIGYIWVSSLDHLHLPDERERGFKVSRYSNATAFFLPLSALQHTLWNLKGFELFCFNIGGDLPSFPDKFLTNDLTAAKQEQWKKKHSHFS